MKVNKDIQQHLSIIVREFPTTVRCSLTNCPSLRRGTGSGKFLCELRDLVGKSVVKQRCRACGAWYTLSFASGPETKEKLLTRTEAAAFAAVSLSTIDRYRRDGILDPIKPGKGENSRVWFKKSQLDGLRQAG